MKHSNYVRYENIVLQPMEIDDCELYRRLRNFDENRIWFNSGRIISYSQQIEWYNKYLNDSDEYMFSAFDDLGRYLGSCGLYDINFEEKSAEFGRFLVNNSVRGQGIGKKMIRAVFVIAKKLELQHIFLNVKKENISAYKTYVDVGFVSLYEKNNSIYMMINL